MKYTQGSVSQNGSISQVTEMAIGFTEEFVESFEACQIWDTVRLFPFWSEFTMGSSLPVFVGRKRSSCGGQIKVWSLGHCQLSHRHFKGIKASSSRCSKILFWAGIEFLHATLNAVGRHKCTLPQCYRRQSSDNTPVLPTVNVWINNKIILNYTAITLLLNNSKEH